MSSEKFQPTWATNPKPPPPPPSSTKPPEYNNNNKNPPPVLYHPQRHRHRHRRSCFCSCLLFTSLFIIILLLLASLTAAILYAIYRPHRPTFSLTSLHISSLTLSSPSSFSSNLSLSLSTHNPNSKISFSYHPFSLELLSSSLPIAAGKLPSFLLPPNNTTHLHAALTSKGLTLHTNEISHLKTLANRHKGFDLQIRMETNARITVSNSTSNKIKLRISCTGIKVATDSKDNFTGNVKTTGVNCKANLRFKIWKWNLSC